LPYNEDSILIVNTDNNSTSYIEVPYKGQGKFVKGHIFGNKIIALPYGEHNPYDYAIIVDTETETCHQIKIELPQNDCKKWHQTQLLHNEIIGLPRGENFDEHFNYSIRFDCTSETYTVLDLSDEWQIYDQDRRCNKKFTTIGEQNGTLWAAPYSELPEFDLLGKYSNNKWEFISTNIKGTSRKYFSNITAKNGTIYFPPAGHDESWDKMLIIKNGEWYTKNLNIGKESKKYFTGAENSLGKIYFIPRGGCVCEDVETWKTQGDLTEILVVDSTNDNIYKIDISYYFKDNTTIEKYNHCVIKNDIIYAFPYGEHENFQKILIFDTIKEEVIKVLDLNYILSSKYKAFEDWYKEADIKHLIIQEYKNKLVSPPFCTKKCEEYNTFKYINHLDIQLDLPFATSKTNTCEIIGDSLWMIPYAIYDNFNTIVQLQDMQPIYHKLQKEGKGQFYSLATNGITGFSFPLGYDQTNFAIYIKDNKVFTYDLPVEGTKLHMGTVYCNGSYWSMPRGDNENYNSILNFDGYEINSIPITDINVKVPRKYSDIIVVKDKLYALPFGEYPGIKEIVEYDTHNNKLNLFTIDMPDFAKKFNGGVLVDNKIIAVPYGDSNSKNSNYGIVFDTITKNIKIFDTELYFGGKYRFRSGVSKNNHAFFFPSGTPSCPILKIDTDGNVKKKVFFTNTLFGRPILFNNTITVMCYDIYTKENFVLEFSDNLDILSQTTILCS